MTASNDTSNDKGIILVVDDAADSLSFMNESLTQAGYTVLVAMDGVQALIIVERMRPDLIILDAMMPGMTGFDVCRKLKDNSELQDIPVMFLTGLSDSEDIVHGLESGGVDFISKPVNFDVLIARVQVHLANARKAKSAYVALDEMGQSAFACNLAGEILWVTQNVSVLMQDKNLKEEQLRKATSNAEFIAWLSSNPLRQSHFRLAIETSTLSVKFLGHLAPGEFLLRLVLQDEASQLLALKREFNVTDREAEVLYWLSRGKTNQEIAQILSMSPRTVNKHLEPIFRKLGVENRTAAVSQALMVLNVM